MFCRENDGNMSRCTAAAASERTATENVRQVDTQSNEHRHHDLQCSVGNAGRPTV